MEYSIAEYFVTSFLVLTSITSAYGLIKGAIDIKNDGNVLLDDDEYTKKKMKKRKKLTR